MVAAAKVQVHSLPQSKGDSQCPFVILSIPLDLEQAVKLHSVNGRHEGCGVCALSALTGLSTGDIAAQIMSKRVEQGTEQYEQQMVARFGEKLAALWLDKRVPVTHKYESIAHILEQFFNVEYSWAHQLLETWLESHAMAR